MNNIVLIGNLTRDPELRYSQGGKAVCRFTIAVSKGLSKEKEQEYKSQGKPTADFPSIVAFGRTAELVANYLSKGRQVAIQGRIQTSSYEGQDGNRVYRTDIVADRVEFIGGQNSNNSVGSNYDYNSENSYNNSDNFGLGDDAFPMDSEDIPF